MPITMLDDSQAREILEKMDFGHLGMSESAQPYIIPVNYVLHEDAVYIHTGFKGKKLDIISGNPKVCFEVSEMGELISGRKACKFSVDYISVIVTGTATIVEDLDERLSALNALMQKHDPEKTYEDLTLDDMKRVNVIKIGISDISGKKYVFKQ